MIRRRKRLSFWSALPPYLGGKRRLCPLIFREIDRLVPRRRWATLTILDGFLGGGSVSLYSKALGFNVISTDIAERSLIVGEALIANSSVCLTREDILQALAPREGDAGLVESKYVPDVFPLPVARAMDGCLARAAASEVPAKAALLKLLAIRIALQSHPMSQIRKGTIHRASTGEWEAITPSCVERYADAPRLATPERLWDLATHINAGVFMGRGTVRRADVLEALPEVAAEVAYFDPPYAAVMSYEKEYRVLDEIFEGAARPTSPFTARDGAKEIDRLLERASHIPLWVLSFGNAACSLEDLREKMGRHGREVRALDLRYQHLPAIATKEKKQANREFLVIGWVPEAPLFEERPPQADRQPAAAAVAFDTSTGVTS